MVVFQALAFLAVSSLHQSPVSAFQPTFRCGSFPRNVAISAKSNMMRKQAELRRKMELAKIQKEGGEEGGYVSASSKPESARLSDKRIKEENDRKRFEELLRTSASSVLNDYSSDGYLNKEQEEEDISAARAGVDRLFEGDPAPTECFQELVSVKTRNALGPQGQDKLVPWLRKNARPEDYLIVLTEPRQKSPEFQQTLKNLVADLDSDFLKSRLIFVNVDSPAENKRWLKKNNLEAKLEHCMYSDEKMEWMRAYTALGDKRLSMTMFIIGNERVQKLARELDVYSVSKVIRNAVKSLKESWL